MGFQYRQLFHTIFHIGKAVTLFLISGIFIHTSVMFLDYNLITEPLYLNLHEKFVESIFSAPMIPMIAIYGSLSIALYFLWHRAKKALLLANRKEVQKEKVELVLKSMQRLTGILAEHIAIHNVEIMSWVESRKRQGRPVSEKVEKPTRKIAKTLQTLSEISFVFPYTDNRPKDLEDIERVLQGRLDEMTGLRETAGGHEAQTQSH